MTQSSKFRNHIYDINKVNRNTIETLNKELVSAKLATLENSIVLDQQKKLEKKDSIIFNQQKELEVF